MTYADKLFGSFHYIGDLRMLVSNLYTWIYNHTGLHLWFQSFYWVDWVIRYQTDKDEKPKYGNIQKCHSFFGPLPKHKRLNMVLATQDLLRGLEESSSNINIEHILDVYPNLVLQITKGDYEYYGKRHAYAGSLIGFINTSCAQRKQ